MKKYIVLSACILLCGCGVQTNTPPRTGISDTAASSVTKTILSETAGENEAAFNGLTTSSETPVFGNSLSCLNNGGLIFNDGNKFIFSNSRGDLTMKTEDTEITLFRAVFPECINVCKDKVYFINRSAGNKVYYYDFIGENSGCYFDEPVLYFAACEKFFVYKSEKNELYINRNNNAKLISGDKVLWIDFYGNYIIFCEMDNNCNVIAYDTETGKRTKLLDYGFFPVVCGSELYYQEKDKGYIRRLDLKTGEDQEHISNWGQNICFIDNELYFLSSQGVCSSETGIIYSNDNASVDRSFECGGELYFTERSANNADSEYYLYKLDVSSGERMLIQ